jgi:DNA-binding MarR family transcriptional regulator
MKSNLHLPAFIPYQLTQLQACVSDTIAEIYSGRFDLSRQEWRVMAALGNGEELTAKHIGLQSNLEKMPASRAIAKMLTQKLIAKAPNSHDKRSALLKLTARGISVYQQLVPMALAREEELLAVFSENERTEFNRMVSKLTAHAQSLAK